MAERSARAGQLAIAQKESVSPRLAPGDKEGGNRGKYKSKSKSNNRVSTRPPNATANDYDYNQESHRDNKSPDLNHGKNIRKLNAHAANSRASNSEGGRGNAGSRVD